MKESTKYIALLLTLSCLPIVTSAQLKYESVPAMSVDSFKSGKADNSASLNSLKINSTAKKIIATTQSGNTREIGLDDLAAIIYIDGIGFTNAALSPDNKLVAFSVRGGSRDLFGIADFQAGQVARLIELIGGGVGKFNWSPDGRWLAVELSLASGLVEVDVVDTRTGDRPLQQAIMRDFHRNEIETKFINWSANGEYLYLSATPYGKRDGTIWMISPVTGQLIQQ